MIIERDVSLNLRKLSNKYPIITISGPRQSGKTTIARETFPQYRYISFEDIDMRKYAKEDPRGFLNENINHVILDEIQRVPDLLSYLQTHTDQSKKTGQYVLTGSQHFLLSEKINQSLAGRTALFTLLPLSINELKAARLLPKNTDKLILNGGYPRLYDKKIAPAHFFPNYINTYVERDVKLIKNITNLSLFERFLKLCAGRTGQLLNLSSLANECSISHTTAREWLTILEASYIIFLLQPHYKNFNKRLVKMPKIYFYDTGLACSLLGIENSSQLKTHYLRGELFESLVITELLKSRFNAGLASNLYFWRDKTGNEIDCLVEKGDKLVPVEIKSGETVNDNYFKGLKLWEKLTGLKGNVVYNGKKKMKYTGFSVVTAENCSGLNSK